MSSPDVAQIAAARALLATRPEGLTLQDVTNLGRGDADAGCDVIRRMLLEGELPIISLHERPDGNLYRLARNAAEVEAQARQFELAAATTMALASGLRAAWYAREGRYSGSSRRPEGQEPS